MCVLLMLEGSFCSCSATALKYFLTKGTPILGMNSHVKNAGVTNSTTKLFQHGLYLWVNIHMEPSFPQVMSSHLSPDSEHPYNSFEEPMIACSRHLQARPDYSLTLASVYFSIQVKCGVISELRSWFRGHPWGHMVWGSSTKQLREGWTWLVFMFSGFGLAWRKCELLEYTTVK